MILFKKRRNTWEKVDVADEKKKVHELHRWTVNDLMTGVSTVFVIVNRTA